MWRWQKDDKTPKEKQLEDSLMSIVKDQLETQELWEIDECVRILFELSYEEWGLSDYFDSTIFSIFVNSKKQTNYE